MSSWILILVLQTGYGVGLNHIEFRTKSGCELFLEDILKKNLTGMFGGPSGACIEVKE